MFSLIYFTLKDDRMNSTFSYTHATLLRSMELPGSKALIHQDTGTTHLLQKLGTPLSTLPNWGLTDGRSWPCEHATALRTLQQSYIP